MYWIVPLLLLLHSLAHSATGLSQEDMGLCNPLLFSTARTDGTLSTAIVSTGSATRPDCSGNKVLLIPAGATWVISSNLTVPARMTVYIPNGASVTINSSIILTLGSMPLCADPITCIVGDGTLVLDTNVPETKVLSSVASGCVTAVPVSSLTLDAFSCYSTVTFSAKWPVPIAQIAAAVGPLNGGDGTYHIAVHRNKSSAVAGWTRQANTHYVWIKSAATPTAVDGVLRIAEITVAGGVITAVTDVRPLGVTDITRYLTQTNPLQSAINGLSLGAKAGRIRVPIGVLVPVPTAVTTPAGMARIEIECENRASGFVWTGGNSATMLTFAVGANASGVYDCFFGKSAAQTGITGVSTTAGGVTVMMNYARNLFHTLDTGISMPGETDDSSLEDNWFFDVNWCVKTGVTGSAPSSNMRFRGNKCHGFTVGGYEIKNASGFDIAGDDFQSTLSPVTAILTDTSANGRLKIYCELGGVNSANRCLDLNTTTRPTANEGGWTVDASHLDCGNGECIQAGFVDGLVVQGTFFHRAGNCIDLTANQTESTIGPGNRFSANCTTQVNEPATTNSMRLGAGPGQRRLPPTVFNAEGSGGNGVTESGSLVILRKDTTATISAFTNIMIENDTGAGSIADQYVVGFNAAAGTHSSVAAAGGAGKSGNVKVTMDGVKTYLPLQASATVFQLVPQATAPATCAIGDIYVDTSGAFCACTSTNTWTNTTAVGSCS